KRPVLAAQHQTRTAVHADTSNIPANIWLNTRNNCGACNQRALPTPSTAHAAMHGRATSQNTSANCHTGNDGAANTPTTATAINHTLGFTTCNEAALNALKPCAVAVCSGAAALRSIFHASQLSHSTPAQL